MNLLKLYQNEFESSGLAILFMAIISGIAQSMLLGIITIVANTAGYNNLNIRFLILYCLAFIIFYIGKKYTLSSSIENAEKIIRKVRVRFSDKLRKTDLTYIENTGQEEIYSKITHNTDSISEGTPVLINGFQSAIVVIFCILYIATLSSVAFLITAIVLTLTFGSYVLNQKSFSSDLKKTIMMEAKFCGMLSNELNGFKELKMNEKKSDDYFNDFSSLSYETEKLKVKVGKQFVTHMMYSQTSFFALLAIVGFVMPRLGEGYSELIIRIAAAILFLIGPVNIMVISIPKFFQTNVAIGVLYELEAILDDIQNKHIGELSARKKFSSFNRIVFEDVIFHYGNIAEPLFTLGPINFSINKGEILFIVGGNGSGKTTFLKLLTALYYHHTGTIKIDDRILSTSSYQSYRELFSIIFTDFHLFDKIYGIEQLDYEKIDSLLKIMQLEHKTDLVDKRFTNINLSTGQKKRIAMIVSLLEDKPICIFDEWAADQDPSFKKYYYEVLLKELNNQGKTIIAVSHDDRYFHYADRVLKMDFGQFIEI